MNMSEEQNCI